MVTFGVYPAVRQTPWLASATGHDPQNADDRVGQEAWPAEHDDPAGLQAGQLGGGRGRHHVPAHEQERRADVAGRRGAGKGVGEVDPGGDIDDGDARSERRGADRGGRRVAIGPRLAEDAGKWLLQKLLGKRRVQLGPGAVVAEGPDADASEPGSVDEVIAQLEGIRRGAV